MEFLKAGGDIMKPEEIKQASPNATPSKRQAASVSPARKAQKKEQFLSFEPNQGKKNTRRNQFGRRDSFMSDSEDPGAMMAQPQVTATLRVLSDIEPSNSLKASISFYQYNTIHLRFTYVHSNTLNIYQCPMHDSEKNLHSVESMILKVWTIYISADI